MRSCFDRLRSQHSVVAKPDALCCKRGSLLTSREISAISFRDESGFNPASLTGNRFRIFRCPRIAPSHQAIDSCCEDSRMENLYLHPISHRRIVRALRASQRVLAETPDHEIRHAHRRKHASLAHSARCVDSCPRSGGRLLFPASTEFSETRLIPHCGDRSPRSPRNANALGLTIRGRFSLRSENGRTDSRTVCAPKSACTFRKRIGALQGANAKHRRQGFQRLGLQTPTGARGAAVAYAEAFIRGVSCRAR
jgi:hypothetical protein